MIPDNQQCDQEYVFEDEQDAPDAVYDGRQLDLYARSKGYGSFAEFAAKCFRRGEWLFATIDPITDGYIANGDFYPTHTHAAVDEVPLKALKRIPTHRVRLQSRLDPSRAVRMIWNRLSQTP
ncbi:hypothetical protein SAMN05444161_8917 [Rhizobiales bacterium GAS191]|nr:hypothetical protein SAMN05444161_8917 [Rhizobiales bacterium GAS191]